MALPKVNFGGSSVAAPNLAVTQQALSTVGNQITDYQKMEALRKQQAIDNARADARLGIAGAQESRAQSDWVAKQKEAEALRVAMLNPETSTDPLASQGTSTGGRLVEVNKRISEAYERDPEAFMKEYDSGKGAGSAAFLHQSIIDAGTQDNIMGDPKNYIQRMTDNAISRGADPKEALTLATAKAATMTTSTKDASAVSKAKYTVEKDLLEKRIATVNKMYDKNSKTGKGKAQSFQNNAKGVVNVIEALRTKFPNTDWGDTAEGGDDLIASVKAYSSKNYHPDDIYAAMILNSSGENDAWFSKDREVQVKGMEISLAKLTADRKAGKNGSAQKALNNKYASDMQKLQGQLATSGTNYINSLGGASGKLTDRQYADKVIADFFNSPTTNITNTTSNKDGSTSVVTKSGETVTITEADNKKIDGTITSVTSAIAEKAADSKKDPNATDAFKESMAAAVADFKLIEADKKLSPFDKGVALVALRVKYGASAAGGFISDALVGLDNIGTSFGNFFRPGNAPKAPITIQEGRDWFAGRDQSQMDARNRFANSTTPSDSDILAIAASKGKVEAVKELSKLYPNLDNAALNAMLDELSGNTVNFNSNNISNPR